MKLAIICFCIGITNLSNITPSFYKLNTNNSTSSSKLLLDHLSLFQEDGDENDSIEKSTNNRLIQVQKRLIRLFYVLFFILVVMAITLYRNFTKKRDLSEELILTNKMLSEQKQDIISLNEELISTNEQLSLQKKEIEKTLIELQNAQHNLVASEKMSALGVLTAGVAHEINNPLNFISSGVIGLKNLVDVIRESLKNNSVIIESTLGKDNEEVLNMFTQSIQLGVERISSIVGSLSSFSHQNLNEEITKCNLNKVIDDCLIILNHEYKNVIEIQKNYGKNENIINADQSKLYQIFINLIVNAIQAIKPNKGVISISINNIENNKVVIEITDTGMGIKPEIINKIFDPFFTTKPTGYGVGLGLSLVYNIIIEHNGTINIESEYGEGTKVLVSLPV